jgi:hypothetical protein
MYTFVSNISVVHHYEDHDDSNTWTGPDGPWGYKEWPHMLVSGKEKRMCRVLKTRMYIVVDEDENGNPVVEKWIGQNNA